MMVLKYKLQREKTMFSKASKILTSSLEKAFFTWGLTVARHPFPVIIIVKVISITVIIIALITVIVISSICHQVILGSLTLSAILSLGLLNLRMEHQVAL